MKLADITRHFRALQDTLGAADRNFEIWWVYKSQHTRPLYIDSMNRYLSFFQVSIHAHFVACVIALYRLYEGRRDTINVNRLVNALPLEKRNKLPAGFDDRMKRAKTIWKKVGVVRNSCFGRLDGDNDFSESFNRADITANEIKELIELTRHLLTDISSTWNDNNDFYLCGDNSCNDTIRLLRDLNKLPKI